MVLKRSLIKNKLSVKGKYQSRRGVKVEGIEVGAQGITSTGITIIQNYFKLDHGGEQAE